MSKVKQVILIRRDLKMRRGKEIAQGSHASGEFLLSKVRQSVESSLISLELKDVEKHWIKEGMAKICLKVNSEEQLHALHKEALAKGLESHLIRDSGRTEFSGQPTYTACAIGPDYAKEIDSITKDLTLY